MAATPTVDPALLSTLRWRSIGPHRGGRVVAVAGHPTEQATFYFGACAGGVWKSDDGGTYWQNISDGYFTSAAVGAIAVSTSDPSVIFVGMGEACPRGNVSAGDGVYRSTDGGRSWTHVGLEATKHIARVRIHPTNPNVVYVAALGDIFGDSTERGVFRSTDCGESWERVLFGDETSGAADLTMDPNNPRIMFATLWEARRKPWNFSSGGPGSAIYRTTDGGDTWENITENKGLPRGHQGTHGRCRISREGWPRVGHHRGRGPGPLPLRRPGRDVGARIGRSEAHPATVVLLPRVRRSPGLRDRVGPEPQVLEVDRRRADVHRGVDAPWRQPRPVDRPYEHEAHDSRQRRRRVRVVQRRGLVVDYLQSADCAVLSDGRGQRVSVQGIRHATGQQRDQHAQPRPRKGGDPLRGQPLRRKLGEWADRGSSRRLQRGVFRRYRQLVGRRRRPAPL